jgi:hypothetical protein
MTEPATVTTPQPTCPHLWDATFPFEPEGDHDHGIMHDQHYCDRRAGHGFDEAHRCGWCGATKPEPPNVSANASAASQATTQDAAPPPEG